jgi:hypothetical protein
LGRRGRALRWTSECFSARFAASVVLHSYPEIAELELPSTTS